MAGATDVTTLGQAGSHPLAPVPPPAGDPDLVDPDDLPRPRMRVAAVERLGPPSEDQAHGWDDSVEVLAGYRHRPAHGDRV
jgi:hypothetical protein